MTSNLKKETEWIKEFRISKGESATTGILNDFLNIMETENKFFEGKVYLKNYKVKIIITEKK